MIRRAGTIGATLLILLAGLQAAPARSVGVRRQADGLHVRSDGIGLLSGRTLDDLKDGKAVRVVLEAATAGSGRGPWVTQAQGRVVLSYDLWEERFAVTFAGPPPRSISHLSPSDAEAWCVDQLRIVPAAVARHGATFWLRVSYRIEDDGQVADGEQEGTTLRGLIDLFSRREAVGARSDVVVSGPMRAE